jgi:DNA topoisomerase-2
VDPKTRKPTKTQFIESYTNLSGNNNVHFEITFAGNTLQQMIKQDSLVKNLKLSANINQSNMYLYDSNHVITKYDTVIDIFTDFYDVRHKMYVKRRNYRIKQLTNQMDLLKYKVKFISQIVNDELVVNKKKKEVLYKELQELKYPQLAIDCEALDSDKSYEYLTGMNILTLTEEKITELNNLYEVKKKELEDYQSSTVEELWKRELLELSEQYDKWFTEKEQEANESNNKNKKSKKKVKKSSDKPRMGSTSNVVVVKAKTKSKAKTKK